MTFYTFSIRCTNKDDLEETYIVESEKAIYQHLFYKLCNDSDWMELLFINTEVAEQVYKHRKEFKLINASLKVNHKRFTEWVQCLLEKYNRGIIPFTDHRYPTNNDTEYFVYTRIHHSKILRQFNWSDDEDSDDDDSDDDGYY